jgi:hypothetical protein
VRHIPAARVAHAPVHVGHRNEPRSRPGSTVLPVGGWVERGGRRGTGSRDGVGGADGTARLNAQRTPRSRPGRGYRRVPARRTPSGRSYRSARRRRRRRPSTPGSATPRDRRGWRGRRRRERPRCRPRAPRRCAAPCGGGARGYRPSVRTRGRAVHTEVEDAVHEPQAGNKRRQSHQSHREQHHRSRLLPFFYSSFSIVISLTFRS